MKEENTNLEQLDQEADEGTFVRDSSVDSDDDFDIEDDDVLMSIIYSIGGFFQFIGRTTITFFKHLPHMISTKVKAKVAERRRMPKRRTINKVYVLVGYTTKEYVDRKYRKERILLRIRKVLIACIVILILVMSWRWFYPKIDTDEYKQMIGVNDMKDLTRDDPFATESTTVAISPESQEVTPIPTNTTLPSET